MEIFANELSFESAITDVSRDFAEINKIYNYIKEYGINSCRIPKKNYAEIYSALIKMDEKNSLDFFFSFFKTPFEENDNVNNHMESYLNEEWKYNGVSCLGLAVAYLSDSVTLSVSLNDWPDHTVYVERGDTIVNVRNITDIKHAELHTDWLQSLKKPELLKTDLTPDSKCIHLRDDHGKDKLFALSKKLLRSEYAVKVINSMSFDSYCGDFIKNCYNDGKIEIVMYWTDKGYGLVLQTTGRNLRETRKIAEILEKKYGYP